MYDGFQEATYQKKITAFLVDKIETIDAEGELNSLATIEETTAQQRQKLAGLQK